MILLLVPEFYAPLRRLGAEYHVKGQAVGAAKEMVGILDFKHSKTELHQVDLMGKVGFCLRQVAAFGDDGRVRLTPTTLHFVAGKSTLLKGESGTGKSTLLQILLGFGQYTGVVEVYDDQDTIATIRWIWRILDISLAIWHKCQHCCPSVFVII